MKENFFALYISIVKGVSSGKALTQMRLLKESEKSCTTKKVKRVPYKIFPDEDIERMIELKKSMSYKQVAKIFQTEDQNIYFHIKRYKPELIKSGVLGYKKARSGRNTYLQDTPDIKKVQ